MRDWMPTDEGCFHVADASSNQVGHECFSYCLGLSEVPEIAPFAVTAAQKEQTPSFLVLCKDAPPHPHVCRLHNVLLCSAGWQGWANPGVWLWPLTLRATVCPKAPKLRSRALLAAPLGAFLPASAAQHQNNFSLQSKRIQVSPISCCHVCPRALAEQKGLRCAEKSL